MHLASVAAAALAFAPAAEAKLVPRFDRAVACSGERVIVELGYTDPYPAPLEVYLVQVRDEPFVNSRFDRRLVLVGKLPRDAAGGASSRLSFVVTVPPGRYTVAVWVRGYASGRWSNAVAGLWRDRELGTRLVLRVRAA